MAAKSPSPISSSWLGISGRNFGNTPAFVSRAQARCVRYERLRSQALSSPATHPCRGPGRHLSIAEPRPPTPAPLVQRGTSEEDSPSRQYASAPMSLSIPSAFALRTSTSMGSRCFKADLSRHSTKRSRSSAATPVARQSQWRQSQQRSRPAGFNEGGQPCLGTLRGLPGDGAIHRFRLHGRLIAPAVTASHTIRRGPHP